MNWKIATRCVLFAVLAIALLLAVAQVGYVRGYYVGIYLASSHLSAPCCDSTGTEAPIFGTLGFVFVHEPSLDSLELVIERQLIQRQVVLDSLEKLLKGLQP